MKHSTGNNKAFGVRSEPFVLLKAKISDEHQLRLKSLNEQFKKDQDILRQAAAANCQRVAGKPNL